MAYSHRIQWTRTSASTCRRSRLCSVLSALVLPGLLQIPSGCATARLTQFHNFAQAGTAYVKGSQAVLDEAGNAAIEADSLIAQKFETLATLADPRAPATLGTAAQGVFDSIGRLSPAIKDASLGGVRIQDHIPQATNFVVQVFKIKALENELKVRSKAIEREANEQNLLDGQNALQGELDKLATVESVLKAVSSLINVVARIVPLV